MLSEENKNKLWCLIQPIKTGFLSNKAGDLIHARPMHLVQDNFAGNLYFFTNIESEKTFEIESNPNVGLTFACPKDQTYVSLSGKALITTDRKLISLYWNPFVAAWFKQGKEDPNIGLIEVNIQQAEIWDTTKNTFVQLFEYIKASISDEKPNLGNHYKIT